MQFIDEENESDEEGLSPEELEELARQQKLEERRQQARQIRRQAFKQVTAPARRAAGRAAKRAGVAAGRAAISAAGTALSALGSALVAAWPVILVILIILGLILLVITVLIALCNAGGTTGALTQGSSALLSLINADFCAAFSGISGTVGKVVEGGDACPRVPRPPNVTVACVDCADLKSTTPPVSVKPTSNALANRGAAAKLQQLTGINNTFWVTEAFCPTVAHQSHDHYNGYGIDVDLKPGHDGDKVKLARLYRDIQALGVSDLLCEYPSGYLSSYGINCSAQDLTTGGHIHFIEPHGHP